MKQEHIKDRLHQAMHWAPQVSKEELAEVAAVVLAVIGEVAAKLGARDRRTCGTGGGSGGRRWPKSSGPHSAIGIGPGLRTDMIGPAPPEQ